MSNDPGEPGARAVALRIGLTAGGLLLALLVVAFIVRPDMMMGMLHAMMRGMTVTH